MVVQIKRKYFLIGLGLGICALVVCGAYWGGQFWENFTEWLNSPAEKGRVSRETGTNKDLWLNGYLGILFRFEMYGVLNWPAIPFLGYFLYRIKNRERWEIGLVLALGLTCIFLGMYGYNNYRYQLTTYPFLLTCILLFGREILLKQNKAVIIGLVSCFGILLIVFSSFLLIKFSSLQKAQASYWQGSLFERFLGGKFPDRLFACIEKEVSVDSRFKVQPGVPPLLYYYLDREMLVNNDGPDLYILTRDYSYAGRRLICEDQNYKLYQLLPKKEARIEIMKGAPDFTYSFSSMTGQKQFTASDLSSVIPPFQLIHECGRFIFQPAQNAGENGLRVRFQGADMSTIPALHFGLCYPENGLDIDISSGDYVTLIAKLRTGTNTKSRPQIFIRDKTETLPWSGSVREWSSKWEDGWKHMKVGRKIRKEFEKVCFGLAWEPKAEGEWIGVSSIEVYIDNETNH